MFNFNIYNRPKKPFQIPHSVFLGLHPENKGFALTKPFLFYKCLSLNVKLKSFFSDTSKFSSKKILKYFFIKKNTLLLNSN